MVCGDPLIVIENRVFLDRDARDLRCRLGGQGSRQSIRAY